MATRTTTRERLPEQNGTIQVFYPDPVRFERDGSVMRYGDDDVVRGYHGFVHVDEMNCADPLACKNPAHQVYFKASVVLKAIPAFRAERGTKVVFACRPSNKEGSKPYAVFMRAAEDQKKERPSKAIPPEVGQGRM